MEIKGEISTFIRCTCGNDVEVYFSNRDFHERTHCECGIVWDIYRPFVETSEDE